MKPNTPEGKGLRLTRLRCEVLRMCDQSLGFTADDMEPVERRAALWLAANGYLTIPGGKRAHITPAGRAALQQSEGGTR